MAGRGLNVVLGEVLAVGDAYYCAPACSNTQHSQRMNASAFWAELGSHIFRRHVALRIEPHRPE